MGVTVLFICLLAVSLIIMVVARICYVMFYNKYKATAPKTWREEPNELNQVV